MKVVHPSFQSIIIGFVQFFKIGICADNNFKIRRIFFVSVNFCKFANILKSELIKTNEQSACGNNSKPSSLILDIANNGLVIRRIILIEPGLFLRIFCCSRKCSYIQDNLIKKKYLQLVQPFCLILFSLIVNHILRYGSN